MSRSFEDRGGRSPLIIKDLDLYPQPPLNTRSPTLNSEEPLLALGAFWPPGQPPSTHKPPIGLNAPFGARCFLAIQASCLSGTCTGVLMHLLVLGAFWHGTVCTVQRRGQNVLMHLLALGAFWHQGSTQPRARNGFSRLNAPFGARCFLAHPRQVQGRHRPVLMHLLALGAFWPTRRKLIVFVHFRES